MAVLIPRDTSFVLFFWTVVLCTIQLFLLRIQSAQAAPIGVPFNSSSTSDIPHNSDLGSGSDDEQADSASDSDEENSPSVFGRIGAWLTKFFKESSDETIFWDMSAEADVPSELHTSTKEDSSWVLGAKHYPRKVPLDYDNLMMHRPEVDLIASFLLPTDIYLEYGSGGSTLNFPRLVNRSYSIEHNCEWAAYMRRTIKERDDLLFNHDSSSHTENGTSAVKPAPSSSGLGHGAGNGKSKAEGKLNQNTQISNRNDNENDSVESDSSYNSNYTASSNVTLHCAEVAPGTHKWGLVSKFEHASYRQFKRYVTAVDSFGVPKFDKVLIDGRARLACALYILPYLKPTSLVFLHDFYTRTHLYGGVLEYYDEVARVLAYVNKDPVLGPLEEPQGLVVLRRKTAITDKMLPLSEETINQKYDRVDWKDGDPVLPSSGPDKLLFYLKGTVSPYHWKRYRSPSSLLRFVYKDVIKIFTFFFAIWGFSKFLDMIWRKQLENAQATYDKASSKSSYESRTGSSTPDFIASQDGVKSAATIHDINNTRYRGHH